MSSRKLGCSKYLLNTYMHTYEDRQKPSFISYPNHIRGGGQVKPYDVNFSEKCLCSNQNISPKYLTRISHQYNTTKYPFWILPDSHDTT